MCTIKNAVFFLFRISCQSQKQANSLCTTKLVKEKLIKQLRKLNEQEDLRQALLSYVSEKVFPRRDILYKFSYQVPVVQKLDSAIHRINLYPVDDADGFRNTYPLGSDLSGG